MCGSVRTTRPVWRITARRSSWDQAGLQAVAELGDLARHGKPYASGSGVLLAMAQRGAQPSQAKRLAEDVGVHREIHHQRMALALLDHLVELVVDHVAEVGRVLLAVDHDLRIVQLDRVRHRQDRAGTRAQPHRLVVHRPVHHVAIAELLQQIERVRGLVGARAHPAPWRRTFLARDGLGDFAQDALLIGLPQPPQVLGVAAAMPHDLVAALADRRHDLRRVVVHQAVGVVRRRQAQLVEQLEQAPDADAVAIVAPGIVAVRLRLAGLGRVMAEAGAEGEPFHAAREDEGKALAIWPTLVGPLGKRYIVVAVVLRQQRLQMLISRAYKPPAWPSTANTIPRASTKTSVICAVGTFDPSGLGGTKLATSRGW